MEDFLFSVLEQEVIAHQVARVLPLNVSKVKVTLFNVGSSFSPDGTAINGSRRCALYPPCHCQCSVLRVFKAIATRTKGKSKQTLKSLKIEPGTSRSESRALANWATTAPTRLLLLVSKETVVLRWWESEKKLGFIKRVDKSWIATEKDLESWHQLVW